MWRLQLTLARGTTNPIILTHTVDPNNAGAKRARTTEEPPTGQGTAIPDLTDLTGSEGPWGIIHHPTIEGVLAAMEGGGGTGSCRRCDTLHRQVHGVVKQLKKAKEGEAEEWNLVEDSIENAAVNREEAKRYREENARLREKLDRMEARDTANRREGGERSGRKWGRGERRRSGKEPGKWGRR